MKKSVLRNKLIRTEIALSGIDEILIDEGSSACKLNLIQAALRNHREDEAREEIVVSWRRSPSLEILNLLLQY